MPPLRMVGIHHVASIIPPLRCLYLDSQEACRPRHNGGASKTSPTRFGMPPCTCELNIPRLILPPPPSLNPSFTFMAHFPIVLRPRDSTYTCAPLPRRTLPADECAFFLESCCFGWLSLNPQTKDRSNKKGARLFVVLLCVLIDI
jgi:hypothetical protein